VPQSSFHEITHSDRLLIDDQTAGIAILIRSQDSLTVCDMLLTMKRETLCVEYLYEIVFMSTYQLVPINRLLRESFSFVSAGESIDYSRSNMTLVVHRGILSLCTRCARTRSMWQVRLLHHRFDTPGAERSWRTDVRQRLRRATTSSHSYWLFCSLFSECSRLIYYSDEARARRRRRRLKARCTNDLTR
jgi:hypothetical protein